MKNIIIITKREFFTQVKKKSFIILTLLAPILLIGFGGLVSVMFKANETSHTFNVIDKSGLFQNLKSSETIQYIHISE
ncbi:MAG: ABC transporter permease, partial [Bergeyella zoohelcum]|nr:ABC transporter permease [Bergeyella zoohelcum]